MGSKPCGISASRATTILGLESFQSQFKVWQRMIEEEYPGYNAENGYALPPDPDNASIRWGTAFEDAIIKLAEEKAGVEIIHREMLYVLPRNEYVTCHITCHIDGYFKDNPPCHAHTLHEGKTTTQYIFRDSWGTPGTDRVPAYIQAQVQHQLLCTGAEQAIVSVLVFPKRPDEWEDEGKILKKDDIYLETGAWNKILNWAIVLDQMGYFHQYPITADRDLHKIMLDTYRAWWKKHIIEKTPPEPENTEDLKRYFPEPIGTIVAAGRAGLQIESLCREYAMTGKEISKTGRLGKRREAIKAEIISWMKKQDSMIDDDSREKTILRDTSGKKLASWTGSKFYCS